MTDPMNQERRRQDFILAIELLGGQRATARLLGITERSMRNLVNGSNPIHMGFIGDITEALRDHARACNDLAKATDPLFTANLIPGERPPVARRRVGDNNG
jgi:DNA-binding transcriptional regulator YdaS (Cro superfamily)